MSQIGVAWRRLLESGMLYRPIQLATTGAFEAPLWAGRLECFRQEGKLDGADPC